MEIFNFKAYYLGPKLYPNYAPPPGIFFHFSRQSRPSELEFARKNLNFLFLGRF